MLPLPERDAGERQAGQRRRHTQGQQFTDAGPPGRPLRSFPGECPADAEGREELEHDGGAGECSPRCVVRERQRGEDGERREGERGQARVRGQRRHARPDQGRRGELLHHERQQEMRRAPARSRSRRRSRPRPPRERPAWPRCGRRGRSAGAGAPSGARSARPRTARPAAGTRPGSSRRRGRRRPPPASRAATGAHSAIPPRPTARAMPVSTASSSGTHTGTSTAWVDGGREQGRRTPQQGQEQLQAEGDEGVRPLAAG